MTFNNEPTGTNQNVGNLALLGLYRQSRAGNRIALEELNLLRAHQGLPPLTMEEVCPPIIGGAVGRAISSLATLGFALVVIGVVLYMLVLIVMVATGAGD